MTTRAPRTPSGLVKKGKYVVELIKVLSYKPASTKELWLKYGSKLGNGLNYVQENLDKLIKSGEVVFVDNDKYFLPEGNDINQPVTQEDEEQEEQDTMDEADKNALHEAANTYRPIFHPAPKSTPHSVQPNNRVYESYEKALDVALKLVKSLDGSKLVSSITNSELVPNSSRSTNSEQIESDGLLIRLSRSLSLEYVIQYAFLMDNVQWEEAAKDYVKLFAAKYNINDNKQKKGDYQSISFEDDK